MIRTLVAVCCVAVLVGPGALRAAPPEAPDPLDGSLISVRVISGLMPYRTVTYEVLWRKKVAVASLYRALVNYNESLSDMKLVPTADFVALLERLEKGGAFVLSDAPAPGFTVGAQSYEVEIRRGGRVRTFKVTEPAAQEDARYDQTIEAVRSFVVGVVGEIPFRNVFFDVGAFGFLNLTSVPMARLHVDGRDTGLDTPIYGYEIGSGKRALKLVAKAEGWEREHTVRIDGGMTTILHLDLR